MRYSSLGLVPTAWQGSIPSEATSLASGSVPPQAKPRREKTRPEQELPEVTFCPPVPVDQGLAGKMGPVLLCGSQEKVQILTHRLASAGAHAG